MMDETVDNDLIETEWMDEDEIPKAKVPGWLPFWGAFVMTFTATLLFFTLMQEPAKKPAKSLPVQTEEPREIDGTEDLDAIWNWYHDELDKAKANDPYSQEAALQIRDFFKLAQSGAPGLAEDLLSLTGKWRLAWAGLNQADQLKYQSWLRERFEEHLFSEKQLDLCISQVIEAYVRHTNAEINRLLLRLKADIDEKRADTPTMLALPAAIQVGQAVELANVIDGQNFIASGYLAGLLTQKIMAGLATRGLLSGTLYSAGAGFSWVSFGTSMLIVLAADLGLSHVLNKLTEPGKRIKDEAVASLLSVQNKILYGRHGKAGLLSSLQEYRTERFATLAKTLKQNLYRKGVK